MKPSGSYVIFNPLWPVPPKVWFQTQAEAQRVAETMALNSKDGHVFYVLKALSGSSRPKATTEHFTTETPLPVVPVQTPARGMSEASPLRQHKLSCSAWDGARCNCPAGEKDDGGR